MPWFNEDTKPGAYYVTMRDAGRVAYLVGSFAKHERALALVSDAMIEACKVRSEYHFCEFGTARIDPVNSSGTIRAVPNSPNSMRL